jgi:hypothetical protein
MKYYSYCEYILELAQVSSCELISKYAPGICEHEPKTLLTFPKYRNGKRRISEQELRFTFACNHGKIAHPGFTFSIETPTVDKYGFSGGGERSAMSDMSFYKDCVKVINIEFKSGNPSQNAIDKDIEKLTKEPVIGVWAHIFETEDSGTVEALFNKFNKAFKKFPVSKKPIAFHILILKSGVLLSRKCRDENLKYSRGIFNIKYEDWNNVSRGRHFINDWQIDKFI